MLVVVSDTHGTDSHRLRGRTLDAVRSADLVVHAGDFTREPVLDAFLDEAATFRAVHGNSDDAAVRSRLPLVRTEEYGGLRFAVVHRRSGGDVALTMLGRERDADVVVTGHTHRPRFDPRGEVAILNPGSYAQPRGAPASHAELEPAAKGIRGRFYTPDGDELDSFHVYE